MSSKVASLVKEDFGIKGTGRWLKGIVHDSLVVDTEKDMFFWNKKNIYGGPLEYLLFVRKVPVHLAKEMVRGINDAVLYNEYGDSNNVIPYEKLVNTLYIRGKENRNYWYNRLLTDSTIDLFKLGYFNGWYTIPVYENGLLNNIQMRRDEPEKKIIPWYRKPPSLFNSDILSIVDEIILTEGVVDSILLNQYGIPAMSKVTGANGWLQEWGRFFIRTNRIYLLFDNDDAGRNGAKRISEFLGQYKCKIYTFEGFKEKYDVIDFFRDGNSKKDFKELIYNESRFTFEI
jgi:5S rRNA maturation endonuclease (ribonuclease M5)